MSAPQSEPSAPAAAAAQVADLAKNVGEKLGEKLGLTENASAPAGGAKPAAPKDKAPKAKKDKKKDNDLPEAQPIHPSYLDKRIELFEKAKAERDAFVAAQPREEIIVTLPDGSTRVGTSWESSPMDIAKQISKSLSEKIVIAKVNGQLWDLERPFEGSASLELLDFDHPEGKRVFWHSSAHVLGEAAELLYGCHLCIGPPTDDGFFYEMAMGDSAAEGRVTRQEDFPALEKLTSKAIKEKQPFERVVLPKEKLLELFAYNKYKQHIIKDKIPDGTSTTVYRCGPMIDLCVGPHIPHTGRIKALSVLKNSASYFLGDQNNDSLQRLYGISFPDNARMKEYKKWLEEASKRDHRKIGKEQELFFFHDLSPGSAFWLPHGARIYEKLMTLMKNEYHKRGFTEVGTPNMFNSKLWETSGHWANYKDDMFTLPVEKETFALKPMNCPGHCLVYAHRDRSYRELPLRLAEFGVIHRNEASGALSGLTRVRRFVQDDAHIFCMASQIEDEMANCFAFLENVYGKFGFSFKLGLSTRPEKKYIGELAVWDAAEARLKSALDKFVPGKWVVNEGDGAFYGPKIDIEIKDAMGREFQCATIQLDFNLPNRFDLKFRAVPGQGTIDGGNFDRPVMIHRAILGSLERFIAILTEHFAGKWPFWLSPRQIMVVPVSTDNYKYAQEVADKLHEEGKFYADADLTDNTLKKKIFNAEKSQYNFILVVGAREEENKAVNVRANGKEVPHSLEDTLKAMTRLAETQGLENVLDI